MDSHLTALGFSDYEARAYAALLKDGPMTGYQIAKSSGVPRPNVYSVLEKLEQKKAVLQIRGPEGLQYAARPAEELLEALRRDFDARLAKAEGALDRLRAAPEPAFAWNLQGPDAVLGKAAELLENAGKKIWIAVWSQEAAALAPAVAKAEGRGVEVTTLCVQGCPRPCGGCRGRVYRYPVAGADARWFVLAVDEEEILLGQFSDEGAVASHTRLGAVVSLGIQYLQNAVAVAEIVRSLGPRLLELVDAEARAALESAGLATSDGAWFERLEAAVRQARSAG